MEGWEVSLPPCTTSAAFHHRFSSRNFHQLPIQISLDSDSFHPPNLTTHQLEGGRFKSTAAGSVENCRGFEAENNSLEELSNLIKLFECTSSSSDASSLLSAIVPLRLIYPSKSLSQFTTPYFPGNLQFHRVCFDFDLEISN
jgi:hypothetical protein